MTQDHILFISHLANRMASIPLPSFSPFSILFQSVFIKCIPNISFSCLELFNDYLHTSQIKPYYLAWDIGPSCARPLLSSPGYLHLPYSLNLQGCWSSWNSLNVCSHISICVFYTSAWNDFLLPSLLFRCFNELKIQGKCIVFTKKSLNSIHSLEWSRYFLITPFYIPPSSNSRVIIRLPNYTGVLRLQCPLRVNTVFYSIFAIFPQSTFPGTKEVLSNDWMNA